MWYQKDWFTGIDYYNLKEKQVHITEMEIKKPVEQRFHEQTEILLCNQWRCRTLNQRREISDSGR